MELNKKQDEAANYINGNLQIVACAGSGKTEVITRRIVKMLQEGIKADEIVAFTFTEKAAENMRERIEKRLKEQAVASNAEGMFIGTIHAFCKKLLLDCTEAFEEFEVLDSVKEHLFISKHSKKCGCETIGLNNGLNDSILFSDCISKMVYEYERYNQWDENVKTAFDEYRQTLYENRFITFSLLIFEVVNRYATDETLATHVKRIKQLTVDEYQDTDDIQEKLIHIIADAGAYVCVVGDDDQTIYQFRGSNADNMINFSKRYKDVKTIELDINYRCDKAIIDIADTVIKNNTKRLTKSMKANSNELGFVDGTLVDDIDLEYEELAKVIKKTKQEGIDYGSMAILIRKRTRLKQLTDKLKREGIPVKTEGTDEFLGGPNYIRFLSIFRFLNQQTDENRILLADEWKNLVEKKSLMAGIRFLQRLDNSREKFEDIFREYINIIGYGENEFLEGFCKILNDVDVIFENDSWTYRLGKLVGFLEKNAIEEYRFSNLIKSEDEDSVQVMTVHKSKGLEFDAVYITDLQEGFFPSNKVGGRKYYTVLGEAFKENKDKYESDIEDERKLFYVAVTRAKKYLYLFSDFSKREVSQFLKEINESEYTHVPIPEKTKKQANSYDISRMADFSLLDWSFGNMWNRQETYEINIDALRNDLREECLAGYFGGGLGGMLMESYEIDRASAEQLVEIARSQRIDLRRYRI